MFTPLVKVTADPLLGRRPNSVRIELHEPGGSPGEATRPKGLTYRPAFDDDAVIAGQGAIGLELLERFRIWKPWSCPLEAEA